MAARVCIIHRIIIAVAIQIPAVAGFGVQICGIIRGDNSAPLGAVVSGVAVIQAGVAGVVIATVTDGVGIGDGCVGGAGSDGAMALAIILPNLPPTVKKKPPRP